MIEKKSVSILIPNYNGRHLLEEYLQYTIAAAEHAQTVYEIIIVDDCSTDGSVQFITEKYPTIRLFINEENKGFSFTCNRGIKEARCELVFLLNSDVKLEPDYFDSQWRYFQRNDTFGVMGRIMNIDKRTIEDAARYMSVKGLQLCTTKHFYSSDHEEFVPTMYLSGANALIDRCKLLAIGGFDEIFSPFYSEDFDLGLRAWRLNWKCYYEHQSICYHQVSASTRKAKAKRWIKYIHYRNKFLLHAIHLNGNQLRIWHMQLLFLELIPKLAMGKFWIMKSYVDFLKHSHEIEHSKHKLAVLMRKHHSCLSIDDIRRKFRKPLVAQNLIWL